MAGRPLGWGQGWGCLDELPWWRSMPTGQDSCQSLQTWGIPPVEDFTAPALPEVHFPAGLGSTCSAVKAESCF